MSIDCTSIAVSYSETRSALAKSLGLGRHRGKAAEAAEPAETIFEKLKRVGRLRKAEKAAEA